jgi:hypothetical protein
MAGARVSRRGASRGCGSDQAVGSWVPHRLQNRASAAFGAPQLLQKTFLTADSA